MAGVLECLLSQRIYIGNLPYTATEEEVEQLFSAHGEVLSCALPTDRDTGRPRGLLVGDLVVLVAFAAMPAGAGEHLLVAGVRGDTATGSGHLGSSLLGVASTVSG